MKTKFKRQTLSDQLADELRTAIEAGRWRSGSYLPAIRDLAQLYEVSANTAHAAVRELERQGLVEYSARQRGLVKAGQTAAAPTVHKTMRQVVVIRPLSPDEDARDNWTGQIIHGIEWELNKHGLHPLMMSTPTNADELRRVMQQVDQLGAYMAGTISFLLSPHLDQEMWGQLAREGRPRVAINRPSQDSTTNFVSTDYHHAGESIGRALGEAGIERVWVLYQESQSNATRIAGLTQGYIHQTSSPLDLTCIPMNDWRDKAGFEAVARRLKDHEPPQAIVVSADPQAYGVFRALHERGLVIPDDVGVIGTTGLALSGHVTPSLTVYQQSMTEIGVAAAQMLVEMLRNQADQLPGRLIRGRMVFRDSFKASA